MNKSILVIIFKPPWPWGYDFKWNYNIYEVINNPISHVFISSFYSLSIF